MARMISLGLAGAFCWGLAPIFGKLGLRDVHPMDGLAARTTVTLAFLLMWVLTTRGLDRIASISSMDWFYLSLEAFLATLAGDLAYYAALKQGGAGTSAVILSVSPVITVWLGSMFLQEGLSTRQLVGVALVALGVLFVAAGG